MELAYPLVIGAARVLFKALDVKVGIEGDDAIPVSGPAILASNHVSYVDFLFVGLAGRCRDRYVRFLTRHDVWDHRAVGLAMTGMHHIPVDRRAPAGAYLVARRALRRGEVVGIFPEAGVSRSFTIRALMPGAVALAAETGAPLIPMVVWGPQRIYTAHQPRDLTRGRPVKITLGAPWWLPPTVDVRSTTQELGRRLTRLLDDVQVRHPDQPVPGVAAPWHPAHLGGSAPTPLEAGWGRIFLVRRSPPWTFSPRLSIRPMGCPDDARVGSCCMRSATRRRGCGGGETG